MKKFFLYISVIVVVLGAVFAYILYSEGVFDSAAPKTKTELKPFEMKCEAGKCAASKCSAN